VSLSEKLEALSTPEPNTGCQLWLGNTRRGYGRVHLDGVTRAAHRAAWEAVNGPIPRGLVVMHRCDERLCVSLCHLALGTPADNSADMARKGRVRSHHRNKSECVHGHSLADAYLRRGYRYCRTCSTVRNRKAKRGGGEPRMAA